MAAASYGTLSEFNGDTDTWPEYLEQMENFFVANDIDNGDKKRAIFLSSCGSKTYSLIRSLVQPDKPASKPYKDSLELIGNHQNRQPSVIMERFLFNNTERKDGESIAQFVARLRKRAEHCNFGDSLKEMIRDRLVCGVRYDRIQQRLLSESTLTLDIAVKTSTAMERASKNLVDIQKQNDQMSKKFEESTYTNSPPFKDIHQVTYSSIPNKPLKYSCYRCGANHSADYCRFKELECFYCHKKGHAASKCRKKMQDKGNISSKSFR